MSSETQPFSVLGFASTHDALDAEAILLDLGIDVRPVPAPQSVGALCGIALRLARAERERALRYLESAGIAVSNWVDTEDR